MREAVQILVNDENELLERTLISPIPCKEKFVCKLFREMSLALDAP